VIRGDSCASPICWVGALHASTLLAVWLGAAVAYLHVVPVIVEPRLCECDMLSGVTIKRCVSVIRKALCHAARQRAGPEWLNREGIASTS
jgi:hypothetical protein